MMSGVITDSDTRPPFERLKNPYKIFPSLRTPCYIIDESALRRNGEILKDVSDRTGCRILLAQKAFSNYDFYPLLSKYLCGTEASGLYEAKLGREKMPDREVHVFCAAYRDDEIAVLTKYADHVVFNSVAQLMKYGEAVRSHGASVGLRINPECSTQSGHGIYDPCSEGSRLGVTREAFDKYMTDDLLNLLDGLHFHTLCEQDSDALELTFGAVSNRFGDILPKIKWLNMGGGHHITRHGYDIPKLEKVISEAQERFGVTVYLEPGEACALNAGYLVSRVLDIVENSGIKTAIIDASAACHMPDVLEMPYVPPVFGAVEAKNPRASGVYRLAGPTCLAGDVIGDYRFAGGLSVGDTIIFGDMAIYSTCKNNTFNGIPLPNIFRLNESGDLQMLTDFGYNEFLSRLGTR